MSPKKQSKKLWPTPSASQARSEGMIKQMRAKVEAGELTREEAEAMIQGSLEPARMKPKEEIEATSQLTSSQLAFPVSPPVLPGSSEARRMTAGSGAKLSGLFRNSGPAGWCLRTLLESSAWSSTTVHLKWTTRRIRRQTSEIWVQRPTRLLNEQGEEYWMRLWSRLRVRVTKYGSTFIQLVPLTPRTDGIESSLWATPSAADSQGTHGGGQGRSLRTDTSLWPTPRNRMTGAATPERTEDENLNLETAVARAMWPTPSTSDHKAVGPAEMAEIAAADEQGRPLMGSHQRLRNLVATPRTPRPNDSQGKAAGENYQTGGQLNPPWECSMMGFPPGWLDIESDGPMEPGKTDSPE